MLWTFLTRILQRITFKHQHLFDLLNVGQPCKLVCICGSLGAENLNMPHCTDNSIRRLVVVCNHFNVRWLSSSSQPVRNKVTRILVSHNNNWSNIICRQSVSISSFLLWKLELLSLCCNAAIGNSEIWACSVTLKFI